MLSQAKLAASSLLVAGHDALARASITLPPQDAPAPHWPWWLRIIAVLGALLFVVIVARAMRRGANRRGPGPSENE
ncbi:MAG TPA: hypothetical protein VLW48_00725 [Candidatus Bathyarchaeia archaeon]|nr:hypothetical protein [Candidatus Bathyarchaeia archaeon]